MVTTIRSTFFIFVHPGKWQHQMFLIFFISTCANPGVIGHYFRPHAAFRSKIESENVSTERLLCFSFFSRFLQCVTGINQCDRVYVYAPQPDQLCRSAIYHFLCCANALIRLAKDSYELPLSLSLEIQFSCKWTRVTVQNAHPDDAHGSRAAAPRGKNRRDTEIHFLRNVMQVRPESKTKIVVYKRKRADWFC